MTTYFQAISAEGDPDFIYYDGRCLWKVREPMPDGAPMRSLTGIKLNSSQFTAYDDCDTCADDHVNNTLFVRYE